MKSLYTLGWSSFFETDLSQDDIQNFSIGRVILVNKTNFIIKNAEVTLPCELAGNLLYATEEIERPKTGDWVLFIPYDNQGIITRVIKRKNALYRKRPGSFDAKQIIASNVDYALIVQCLEMGININRLERTLVQIKLANIQPIVVINKMDLLNQDSLTHSIIEDLKRKYSTFLVSAASGQGMEQLKQQIKPGKTYVLIGASGVGKSSLINALDSTRTRQTACVSHSTHKGAHTTTSRELILLPDSGIIIDTPGTREFGLAHEGEFSTDTISDQISKLSSRCKYQDCSHQNEPGCAVIEAIQKGIITHGEYQNYLKLQREMEHYKSNLQQRKHKGKELSKIIKYAKKHKTK